MAERMAEKMAVMTVELMAVRLVAKTDEKKVVWKANSMVYWMAVKMAVKLVEMMVGMMVVSMVVSMVVTMAD